MNIGKSISKAIKEGKWLDISYINQSGTKTYYWIAVNDINFDEKKLKVRMFNSTKSMDVFETWIAFDKIQSAQVIDLTSYDVPEKLVEKIERNLDKVQWLEFDSFNHNVLNYYLECNDLDNDPNQKEYYLIEGIDYNRLKENKFYKLTDEQAKKIIEDIYHFDLKNTSNSFYTLALNVLSIDENKRKFVIAYYVVTFDPIKKSLVIKDSLSFNKSFIEEGRRHSLFNYINMDMDEFISKYGENKSFYNQLIANNLRANEKINERPDMMLLQRDVLINLAETYEVVETKFQRNQLPVPLKAFFGNISKRNYVRRKEPSLIISDKRINANQMRVLYNAMKYPLTYVQGPPGTGKTQTIVNVVLSAFYNEKTLLICSGNNKPVDGIVEKLQFKYRDNEIPFPYLRLGKIEEVKRATKVIKQLYSYNFNKKPNDDMLNNIKVRDDNNNSRLIELLNLQEKREDLQELLENSQKLIAGFEDKSSRIINIAKDKITELENQLQGLAQVDEEELVSLVMPLESNFYLSQYLFYKSLQCIEKLKKPKYSELIQICSIVDDDERAMEFNKWLENDENMKRLTEVFPVIFSTNISSRRLGSPKFMFDLVVMDEAGQCNVATALIPIAKANSLLLVGDPNQLKPVIVLEDKVNEALKEKYNVSKVYDYKANSILDIMLANDNISKYILLKYHYRCGKKIIGFSNKRYYNNSLNVSAIKFDGNISVLDVDNKNVRQKNEAYDEAIAIAEYIKRNNIDDAYIITPFINQKECIDDILKKYNITGIDSGTVHSLQGAERGTIIFSTALSDKTGARTYAWLKNNYELINVATTRAKENLVVVANSRVVNNLSDGKDDLYNLIQYAKSNGKLDVPQSETIKVQIGKSNASLAEDEFFKTVTHFCSCYKNFECDRNIAVEKVFPTLAGSIPSGMEFDLVLYEKKLFGKKPVVIFEVNGAEHFAVAERERCDKLKMNICKKNNVKLVMIPNPMVKAYEHIKSIIDACSKKETSIQESMFSQI